MSKDKKLYKIENKLGTFYIVAGTFDEAANELKARLDQADYGFFQYRNIPAIEHVATQSFCHDGPKQSFSDREPNLIISGSDPICQPEPSSMTILQECDTITEALSKKMSAQDFRISDQDIVDCDGLGGSFENGFCEGIIVALDHLRPLDREAALREICNGIKASATEKRKEDESV